MRLLLATLGIVMIAAGCAGRGPGAAAPSPGATATIAATATPAPASATPPAVAPVTPAPTERLIEATVTFDGTTCAYAGPTVIPVGSAVAWTVVSTPAAVAASRPAALLVYTVTFGTTWADILAWNERHGSASDPPPFLGLYVQVWTPEDIAAGAAMRTLARPYDLSINCMYENEDDLAVVPAVLVRVLGD